MVRDQYGTERKIRLARKRGQTIQSLEGRIRNFGLHPKGTEKPLKNGKNGSERGGWDEDGGCGENETIRDMCWKQCWWDLLMNWT